MAALVFYERARHGGKKKFLSLLWTILFHLFERPLTLISVFNIVYFTLKYLRIIKRCRNQVETLSPCPMPFKETMSI